MPETVSTRDWSQLPETVISSRGSIRLWQTLRDLVAFRDLFRSFMVRDLKIRYKQTALGVLWIILQPLLTSGIFSVVFGSLGAFAEQGQLERLSFFLAGLVPWMSFASAVSNASASMETNAHLVSKVYFPRLVVPLAYIAGSVIDFLIAFAVLCVMASVAGALSWQLLALMPLLLALQLLWAAGLGILLGALHAQYRDIKYLIPFLLQSGMFICVLMPLSKWPPLVRGLLAWHPMTGVIESYRALLQGTPIPWLLLAQGTALSVAFGIFAVAFFRRRESRLIDLL